jgi:hypothetical protein
MRKILLICLLFFVVLGTASATGYSMFPGSVDVPYAPGQTYELSFHITSDNGYEIVKVIKQGPFSDYLEPEQSSLTIVNGYVELKFKFTVPEISEPGVYQTFVGIEQLPPETFYGQQSVIAVLRVLGVVRIIVPCEGKCAKLALIAGDVEVGQKAYFQARFTNTGKETILNAEGDVRLGDSYIVPLTGISNITAGQTQTMYAELDTTDMAAGKYVANATVNFDGYATSATTGFRMGKFALEFESINAPDVVQNQTAQINIWVRSLWTQPISDVFAEVFIYDAAGTRISQSITPSATINSWSDAALVSFWDTTNVPLGNYTIRANVHYADQIISGEGKINVVAAKPAEQAENTSMATTVAIALLIMMFVLFALVVKRKQKRRW